MSQELYPHQIEDESYVRSPSGDSAQIGYYVTGASNPYSACLRVPFQINANYPGNERLLVQSIEARPAKGVSGTTETTHWRVIVRFSEKPPENEQGTQWRYVSTMVDEESIYDANGEIISVSYSWSTVTSGTSLIPADGGFAAYDNDAIPQTITATKTVKVSRQIPSPTMIASQYYDGATITSIKRFTAAGGKINSTEFLGYPAGSLLCKIDGAVQESRGYRVDYSFVVAPSASWDKRVFYTNDDGTIPKDIVPGVGSKDVRVYKQFNFNDLGLTTN